MKYNLSIIIPFFNSRKLIEKNFKKIYNLKKKFNGVEIIYIDNNSTDKTYKILKKKQLILKNFSLFKTDKKKGQGPGVARNLGVIKSKSEYILYLDVDDYLKIKNFKKIISFLKIYKPNITYLEKKSDQILAPYIMYNKYNLKKYFKNTNNMEIIGIILNKDFLIKNKIFFKSKFYEDIFYSFLAHFYNKKKIFTSSDIIYNKKMNKDSITNRKTSIFHLYSKFNAWKSIDLFLKKQLVKKNYKKLLPHIQYRWRGELANEYIKINKQILHKKKKLFLINSIVKKYKRFILNNYKFVTFKDRIFSQLIK